MVKRFIKVVHKEINGLHQAAYLLGFFGIMSQLLAFMRDRLLANQFGASLDLDIYYAAFRIPDFIFLSVASMVSIAVIVPFLLEEMDDGPKSAREFTNNIFSFFFLSMFVISFIFYIISPFVLEYIFPGFRGESLEKLIFLTRMLLLSPIFLGLSNFFASIVQVHKRFLIYAIAPLVYNIGIILGIIVLGKRIGILGVVVGVLVGAFFHLAIQIPFIVSNGLMPRFLFNWKWNIIKRVLVTSFPRTIALGLNHLSLIFLVSIASLMAEGSVSIFNFSLNMQSLPLTIVGVSYTSAVFPMLSRLYVRSDYDSFNKQLITTAKHIIFWILPIVSMLIVLRAQIVRTVLGSGQFSWDDTRLTAAMLAIFSVSAVFQGLMLLFVRAFYSRGDTRTPFIINLFCTSFMVILAYYFSSPNFSGNGLQAFLERLLKVEGIYGTEVLALAFSYSIGTILNAFVLLFYLNKSITGLASELYKYTLGIFVSSLVMGFITYNVLGQLVHLLDTDTLLGIFLQGFFAGICGIISGVAVLIAFQNNEVKTIIDTLHKRFWGLKTVSTDSDIQPFI